MGTKLSIAADKKNGNGGDDGVDNQAGATSGTFLFTSTLLQSLSTVQRLAKVVGDLFVTPSYTVDDNDGWYQQAVVRIDQMDALLLRLHAAIKNLMDARRSLSSKEADLSKSLLALASRDDDVSMVHAFSKLGETHDNLFMAEYHKTEMISYQLDAPLKVSPMTHFPYDSYQLGPTLQEQLRTTQALKRVFHERVVKWRDWQAQLQSVARRRDARLRLELTGKEQDADKTKALEEEIEAGETKAEQLESDYLTLGEVIRDEYHRYFKQRREDIKKAIILYLELLIENEGRVLSYWESFSVEMASPSE